jgi:hypothetical protein
MADEKPLITEPINHGNIVALGSFNPLILHPEWFGRHSVVPSEEVAVLFAEPIKREIPEIGAIIEFGSHFAVDSNKASINFKSFKLTVERERFQAECTKRENFPLMVNSIKKIFTILCETPIKAYGINFNGHFIFENMTRLSALFSPTDLANELFEGEFDYGFVVRKKLNQSVINLKSEPSTKLDGGVFIHANNHYEPDNSNPAFFVDNISDDFGDTLRYTDNLILKSFGSPVERA